MLSCRKWQKALSVHPNPVLWHRHRKKQKKEKYMDSNQAIWDHVLQYLRQSAGFSEATFSIWFKDLQLEKFNDSYFYLSALEQYKAEFVFKIYYKKLKSAIFEILGSRAELIFFSREAHGDKIGEYIAEHIRSDLLPERALSRERQTEEYENEPPLSEEEKQKVGGPRGTIIKTEIPPVKEGAEYTFENFIVGSTNRVAHDACVAISKNPSEVWNPLFIYSPSGMGKTHLLYAISNEIIRYNPSKRISYVTGEDFGNELITDLLQKKPMHYFREKYRNVDVLLVDDIQFVAGKETVQEEFFHTFEALYHQRKQIILTSDRPPKDMKSLDNRLRTRFEWGLTVDIQPPELELRIAIAKSKAEILGLKAPDSVLEFLADNIRSSVRQLEGAVKRLHAYSALYGKEVDIPLARQCINDMIPKVSVDNIVEKTFEKVCNKYQVGVKDITGKRRNANIVIARHVATYILRQITELSSIEIARYFSQDHSTILSAFRNVEKKIDDNPAFEEEVSSLIREIQE